MSAPAIYFFLVIYKRSFLFKCMYEIREVYSFYTVFANLSTNTKVVTKYKYRRNI